MILHDYDYIYIYILLTESMGIYYYNYYHKDYVISKRKGFNNQK